MDDVLPGFWIKELIVALRRYSSSTARRFRALKKNHVPPIIAATAIIPTTAPAAMPALLPPDLLLEDPDAPFTTVTVEPPTVTTDGGALFELDGVDEGASMLSTKF